MTIGGDGAVRRLLALDIGQRRVGVAATDDLGMIAIPLTTLAASPRLALFAEVDRLVAERRITRVVVGLPLDSSGQPGRQARSVQGLVDRLRDRLQVDVVTWDERMSTQHASRGLEATGVRGARRRAVIDAAAACVILQNYMSAVRGDHD